MIEQSAIISIALISFGFSVLCLILWQDSRIKLLRLQGKFEPYKRKKYFLTLNEKRLYSLLQPILQPKGYLLIPQLHLSTLLEVKDSARDMMGKFEYINKLFVDFVIFNREFDPVLIIELNDSTHTWNSRKSRDEFVQQALKETGLKLLTISTSDLDNPVKITQLIEESINS